MKFVSILTVFARLDFQAISRRSRILFQSCLVIAAAIAASSPAQAQIVSDNFEIKLVNDYDFVWSDAGTGTRGGLVILRPKAPKGYYITGYVMMGGYDTIKGGHDGINTRTPTLNEKKLPYTIALKPKPGKLHLLKHPLSYKKLWDTRDSGSLIDGILQEPVCPKNHHAIGGRFVYKDTDKDLNLICIAHSEVKAASWKSPPVWTDHGSGAKLSGSIWKVQNTAKNRKGEIFVEPTSGFPSGSHKPPKTKPYVLKFRFADLPSIFKKPGGDLHQQLEAVKPKFTKNYVDEYASYQSTEIKIPPYKVSAVMVDDPGYSMIDKWANGAQYEIRRTLSWEPLKQYDNIANCLDTGDNDEEHLSWAKGKANGKSWSATVGTEISYTSTAEVAPLGVGGEFSVGISANFAAEIGGSSEKSSEETQTHVTKLDPGIVKTLFLQQSKYEIWRTKPDSEPVQIQISKANDSFSHDIYTDKYYKEGYSKDNPCGDKPKAEPEKTVSNDNSGSGSSVYDGVLQNELNYDTKEDVGGSQYDESNNFHLLDAGHTLVKGYKHWSKSKSHYLVFEKRGDLVVYDENDEYIWGMREHIARKGHVDKVIYQHDGNLAAYGKNDEYMWSALHEKSPTGTELHLTDEGVLQIVHPDGTIAWEAED